MLARRLVELGYLRVDVVEHRGEFAVRGGVLDVFPAEQRRPVRLEFWGDEIDSIRRFVPSTQLSASAVERRRGRAGARADPRRRAAGAAAPRPRSRRRPDRGPARPGRGRRSRPTGSSRRRPFLFDELPAPADALPDGPWVVLTEARRTGSRARCAAHDDAEALAEALRWPGPRIVRSLGGRARGPRPGAPVVVHRGRRSGAPVVGAAAGESRGARRAAPRTCTRSGTTSW